MSRVKIISKVFLVAGFEVPGRPGIIGIVILNGFSPNWFGVCLHWNTDDPMKTWICFR